VGHEHEWGGGRFALTETPQRVLVVGGGPAGLEAARVAAERGHDVILAEAAPHLGGAFRLAGLQPRRAQILDLIDWYERQLRQLGVDIRLNCYLEAEEIAAMDVAHVVLATGTQPDATGFQKALPHVAQLPGAERSNVATVEDVMSRAIRPGGNVVLLDEGGHWRGIGTAWQLAAAGH
ncbi:MAG: FAD-dependent oxidoreductase, partial [Paracoccus sp. (in: a-proteobacteria)]